MSPSPAVSVASFRRLPCTATALAVGIAFVFLFVSVSSAGAVTLLNRCYGLPATITGTTDAGETIQGTPGDDVIIAGAGNDRIFTNGGRDYVCAGGGDDLVVAGTETDILNDPVVLAGDDGDDTLVGGAGNDYIDGGRGTDSCYGSGGTDHVYGCTNPTTFVVGQSAPDFVAPTAFGNRFRLANMIGQNVMLDFSSLWCGPSVSMAAQAVSTQQNLRAAGIKFQYVLGEVEGQIPGRPSKRTDAERWSEAWNMSQIALLHSDGSAYSNLFNQMAEFDAENFAYDPDAGTNQAFPTLVFVDAKGIVQRVNVGALTGQQIEDYYKTGLPNPASATRGGASMVGVDIENLTAFINTLSITSAAKTTLTDELSSAMKALDLWMKPKRTACDWMKDFSATLAKTPGIGIADRADITAAASNIRTKLGCKK